MRTAPEPNDFGTEQGKHDARLGIFGCGENLSSALQWLPVEATFRGALLTWLSPTWVHVALSLGSLRIDQYFACNVILIN
jgi:hypothetical protein